MARTPDFNMSTSAATTGAVISHVKTDKKVYAPTFDCCAHCAGKTGVATNLINHLVDQKIPATFFLTGKWMMDHPVEAKKLMTAPNLELGFHSMVHSDFTLASTDIPHELNATRAIYDKMLDQLRKSGQISKELYDQRKQANLFRFPSGHFNASAVDAVKKAGYIPVQWNDTADNKMTPLFDKQRNKNGDITLMHANMTGRVRGTDKSFASYHQHMVDSGYQSLTVSDLLKTGTIKYTSQPDRLNVHDREVIQRVQQANLKANFYKNEQQAWLAKHPSDAEPLQRIAQRPTARA